MGEVAGIQCLYSGYTYSCFCAAACVYTTVAAECDTWDQAHHICCCIYNTTVTACECVRKHVLMCLNTLLCLCWWPWQQVGELPGVSQFWWEDQRQVGLSLAWCVQINELSLTHISCYCCRLGQAGNRDTELARIHQTHLYCPTNVSGYHAMPAPYKIWIRNEHWCIVFFCYQNLVLFLRF